MTWAASCSVRAPWACRAGKAGRVAPCRTGLGRLWLSKRTRSKMDANDKLWTCRHCLACSIEQPGSPFGLKERHRPDVSVTEDSQQGRQCGRRAQSGTPARRSRARSWRQSSRNGLTGHWVGQPGSRDCTARTATHSSNTHSQQSHLQKLLEVAAVADLSDHVGMVVILQDQQHAELCR